MGATFAKFVTKEQHYLSGSLEVWSYLCSNWQF